MKRLMLALGFMVALAAPAKADSGYFIVLVSNMAGPAYGGPFQSWSDCNRVKNAAMGTDAYLYACVTRFY